MVKREFQEDNFLSLQIIHHTQIITAIYIEVGTISLWNVWVILEVCLS